MKKNIKKYMKKVGDKHGFTLIEVLIVVAIIGILASVILVSTNTAREKARDAKRTLDLKELRTALLLYYDANKRYPTNSEFAKGVDGTPAGYKYLAPTYIPQVPTDPLTKASYKYISVTDGTTKTSCLGYHVGAQTEGLTSSAGVLDSDDDLLEGDAKQTPCTTGLPTGASAGAKFNGIDCKTASSEADVSKDTCYDIYQNQ